MPDPRAIPVGDPYLPPGVRQSDLDDPPAQDGEAWARQADADYDREMDRASRCEGGVRPR